MFSKLKNAERFQNTDKIPLPNLLSLRQEFRIEITAAIAAISNHVESGVCMIGRVSTSAVGSVGSRIPSIHRRVALCVQSEDQIVERHRFERRAVSAVAESESEAKQRELVAGRS